MKENFIETLRNGFETNQIGNALTNECATKLTLFADMLVETNKRYNLTAITDDEGIILKHFIDSASISQFIPHCASVIDVGCGAGFPSIPLAIIRPDLSITSIDSTGKKIEFVKQSSKELKLSNINALCVRAEDYANVSRETFDVCTSRAVARLNVLAEICIPFIKVGGKFIAMKSSKGGEELKDAQNGIQKLGCKQELLMQKTFSLGGESIDREIYIFAKTSNTPREYPRNYSQIVKRPL